MDEKKVLIAEDELIVAEDIKASLTNLNYQVTDIVDNYEDIVESIEREEPSIALMDIRLKSEMDGIEIASKLKKEYNIPVIFLTAHTETSYVKKAKSVEPYGYLVKPFKEKELLSTLETGLYKYKMEQKLIASEQKYRSIVENSYGCIFILDDNCNIRYTNPTFQQVIDENENKILNSNFCNYLAEGEEQKFKKYINSDKKESEQFQIRLHTQNDNALRLLEGVTTELNGQENQKRIICQFMDVTEKKKSEKQLKLFAHAIKSINESIVITNENSEITFVNQAFQDCYGYDEDEVIGQSVDMLRPPDFSEEKDKEISRETHQEEGWRGEVKNVRKDGTEFPIHLSTSEITDNQGNYLASIGISRDITEKRKMQKQINQTQRLESIGKLSGGVAHDFNNILSVITGYSDILLSEIDEEDEKYGFINEIAKAGERASRLTRQLLAFSRKQEIQLSVVAINNIIDNLKKMLRRLISEDIDIEFDLGEDIDPIKADPGQIEQILMNLIVNARDAIEMQEEDRNKKITVKTRQVYLDEDFVSNHVESEKGPHVLISVSDTGVGMAEETMEKIFDPFFTTKGEGRGTGLGLSTVYGIVKQNNGSVYPYSEPGQGTKFNIYWPSLEVEEEFIREKEKLDDEGFQGRETILLVEDEDQVLELVKNILESYGYTIITASNGKEALEIGKENLSELDLLFTDIVMPKMNGIKLIKNMKKISSDLKVLFSSGYSGFDIDDFEEIKSEYEFIEKPFRKKTLAKKVREVLDQEE